METGKTVETRISAVTVYTDRARVTRRGVVSLNGREQELVIAGLPANLQTESVRTSGAGTVVVRLLGLRTELIYATEPVAERVAQMSQEIQQLESQKREVKDQIKSLEMQRSFVKSLSEKSVEKFSRCLAQQQVGLDEIRALLSFVGQQYSELSGAIAQQEKEQHEIEKQLQALSQQLQQVISPQAKESYSIIVTISAAAAGDFELEVSYVVTQALWTPLYDLRVNLSGDTVNLSYLAEVQQNTGEDWTNVALTLSTAKPGLGTLPPKLTPWYIDIIYTPPEFIGRRRVATSLPAAPKSLTLAEDIVLDSLDAASAAPVGGSFQAETVVAEVPTEGGVVTFELDGGSNIPGGGANHKITIFSEDYPSSTQYIAMPRLVSFAYLQAIVTNPATGVTLLPGKANIFRENTFVGTTYLENVAPGQEFKLNLGIDESLKISRDLVERQVDKKLIGGQRRTTYAYRLAIANLLDDRANLKLTEQLPVSRNEQLKVRLTRSNPQIQTGEMGMLEWSRVLPPQSQQELYYQFVVEHSGDLNIVGLDI